MTQALQGRSLSRDAWRRFYRNPLALGSLIVLLIVVVACVCGPWVVPHNPSQQRPWLGAQALFAQPVNAWQENRLIVGRLAEVPPAARQTTTLNIRFRETVSSDYAITLRRGKISLLQRVAGGVVLPELKIAEGNWQLLTGRDSRVPLDMGPLILRRGDPLPAALQDAGRRFTLRHLSQDREVTAEAQLNAGLVEALRIEQQPAERLQLSGDQIISWRADGHDLRSFHLLGTDRMGRDLLVRILHGGRISLMVGLVATLVSVAIGVLYGLIAGYVGGRTDRTMMAVIDILYAIPFLFLVILLLVSFQRSLLMLFIALGAVQWLTMARIIRAQALSLRQREFIEAAQVTGASHAAIIGRHLLPNCLGTVIVYATLTVPLVILQESFLAFIGLQVELGDGRALDSWGSLVQQGMNSLDKQGGDRWWLLVFPALTMAVTLLALNTLGDGLRDAFDPRLRGAGRNG